MAVPPPGARPRGRVLIVVILGVAVPAMLLAGLGIYLTLRITRAVQDETARYNSYIALQIGQAFENELLERVRQGTVQAENLARVNAPPVGIVAALGAGNPEFEAPHFVPVEMLNGYTVLTVEGQPLLYAQGGKTRQDEYFAGLLLRDSNGQAMGAGGWWVDPRRFLLQHLEEVVRERLPSNERLYGGYESTRRLSVTLLGPLGEELHRVRQPGDLGTARTEMLKGPFEGYAVRVAPAEGAPAALASRFVWFEITFIGLMGMAIVLATTFGLRYAVRQLELAHLKSSFVSNITHELKTPIAMIRLAVETLEMRRFSSPEEGEGFLRSIERETLRLQQLVDNILDFARLEAGQGLVRNQPVDLAALVRDTVDGFRPRLEHQGFRLEVDVPEELPPVRGDAIALSHCVLNLLDNALKYSRAQREVRVSAGARADAVTVTVADRGIGIAPEDQRRIFEKFARVETGLVHNVKGAGLGLTLVDQIVRAHGGRVEVESTLGGGSAFTLVLPRADGAEAPGAHAHRKTGHVTGGDPT